MENPVPPVAPPPLPPLRPPPTNTVLLSHLPPELHNRQSLREWLVACGNTRSVQFVPLPKVDDGTKTIPLADASQHASTVSALLTMSHADAALKVAVAVRYFREHGDDEFNKLTAFLVPTNPDIPVPPAVLDETTEKILGDGLLSKFPREAFNRSGNNNEANAKHTPTNPAESTPTTAAGATAKKSKFDVLDEYAEEDGAGDDPLESPAVLQLVREFRRNLEKQQGTKAVKRQEAVHLRIESMKDMVRQRMLQEASNPGLPPPFPPPPPPSGAPPPPPGGVSSLPPPPPPPPAQGTLPPAPRGISNMPAWMTKQQNPEGGEPPSKKIKTTGEASLPSNWKTLPFATVSDIAALRNFVGEQIQQLLGEQEASFVDFVVSNVNGNKTPEQLLPELQDVLEEDSVAFCQAVWQRAQELAS